MKYSLFSDITPNILRLENYPTPISQERTEKQTAAYRLLYLRQGAIEFEAMGKQFSLKSGDLLFFLPYQNYSTVIDRDTVLVNINFDFFRTSEASRGEAPRMVYFADEVSGMPTATELCMFSDAPEFSEPFRLEYQPAIEDAVDRLCEEQNQRLIDYRLRQNAILCDLLVQIHRQAAAAENPRLLPVTAEILAYINENCEGPLDRKRIGQLFHYHPNTINHMVRAATGMTLHQYITDTRLHRAMELLSTTEQPVTEIAARLDFYDSSHFAAVFRRNTGMLPTDYRERTEYGQNGKKEISLSKNHI